MKDAIQRDCTRYAPGIEIISVRVTKPNIPVNIRRNFELMEEERTKVCLQKQSCTVIYNSECLRCYYLCSIYIMH
jgi:hypothetical protein